jgi:flagellar hook-associated protein 2
MATISSPGVGSGLDVNGLITKLMEVEQQPLVALTTKEASYQAKLSAFGTLKSAVASLESKAFALKSNSLYAARSATISDATVATASANTAATPGTYNLQVIDLAQAHTIASQTFTSLTQDISTVDGKLKIELGTWTGGVYTADPGKAPVSVAISASTSSLSDIRDAINNANAGVKASIVTVSEGQYKLTLTSNSPGGNSSLRITALDTSDVPVATNNTDLAKFSFNPTAAALTGKEFEVTAAAQDAHIKVDGVDLYRTSNTVSDAITGVSLSLLKSGATATLKVAANTEASSTAMGAFVTAYNEINAQLRDLTSYNSATKQGALLLGDAGARGLQATLKSMVTNVFGGSGSIQRLADLGVSMQRNGSLEFNTTTYANAMNKNAAGVIEAMTSTTEGKPGLAVTLASKLKALISENGLIAGKTEGFENSIADLSKQRSRVALRLTQIEARYRKQYTSLDTLVASMQQTSTYLTRQLAALPSSSS